MLLERVIQLSRDFLLPVEAITKDSRMFMREDSSGKYLQALNEMQEEKTVFEVQVIFYL